MDNYVDERDYALLEADRHTFFVLKRIMSGDCRLLLTDHERLIICFSDDPYPVWIWTPDDASEDEFERAYQLAAENSLLEKGRHFNVKYELADFFMNKAAVCGIKLDMLTNMFAYDCPKLVKPDKEADGDICTASADDLDELVRFMDMFHTETGIDGKNMEDYRRDALAYIESGHMYFWKNKEGKKTACCKYGPNGDMASINLVFTLPEERRKHYAGNLVYRVTELASDAGYLPMLYTDAYYAASNACYEKIGYILRGKLCTIGL